MVKHLKIIGSVITIVAIYVAITVGAAVIVHNPITAALIANIVTLVIGAVWRWIYINHKRFTIPDTDWHVMLTIPVLIVVWYLSVKIAQTVALYVTDSQYAHVKEVLASTPHSIIVITVLIAAPCGEEMLVRGLIYPLLRRQYSFPITLGVTASVFALLHGNITQIIVVTMLGIFLGIVYEKFHSVMLTIALHMLFNLLSGVMPTVDPFTTHPVVSCLCAWIGMCLAVGYFMNNVKQHSTKLHNNKNVTHLH